MESIIDFAISNMHMIRNVFVGALIGYFTNWLAIRMIFRPRKPWKIGSVRMPFTPGVMIRNQKRLARAVADAVVGTLLTEGDIIKAFDSSRMRSAFISNVENAVYDDLISLSDISYFKANRQSICEAASDKLSQAIASEIRNADIGSVVSDVASSGGLGSLISNPFVSLALGGSIKDVIADAISGYIDSKGKDLIRGRLLEKLLELSEKPISEGLGAMSLEKSDFDGIIGSAYDAIANADIGEIIKSADLRGIIEDRISNMDPAELEKLTLAVMRKELRSIVNLGAFLGAAIGVLNSLLR